MTKSELRAEVFRRLRESSSSPVYFSVADVDAAIADAYAEMSDATEWHEEWRTIDLLALRPYYDLRHVISDREILTVGPVYHDDTRRWLTPSSVAELDQLDNRWESVTGEPSRVILRGPWHVGYWPRALTDTGTVTQYVTTLPTPLSDDLDVPGFPDAYHDGIVAWALADLFGQDAEPDLALKAWQDYLGFEAALTAFVKQRASVPLRHGYGQ